MVQWQGKMRLSLLLLYSHGAYDIERLPQCFMSLPILPMTRQPGCERLAASSVASLLDH